MVALIILTMIWVPISGVREHVCTWYGNEFLGRKPSAAWHGVADVVVDEVTYGIAAPIEIPLGSYVRVCRTGTCSDSTRLLSTDYNGRCVVARVLDRRARSIPGYWDLWPATAEALGFGPSWAHRGLDAGCIQATVEIRRIGRIQWDLISTFTK